MASILLIPESHLISRIEKLEKKIANGTVENPEKKIYKILNLMEKIEKDNAENLKQVKFLGLMPYHWKLIKQGILTLSFISTTASALAAVLATDAQNEMNCEVPDSVVGTTTAAASLILITGIFEWALECLGSKQKKHIRELKEKYGNALLLKMFFQSYKEFIASEKSNIDECVVNLKNMPEKAMPFSIRDRWMSLIIRLLPKDAPLKKKLMREKELAEIIKNAKDNSVVSNGSTAVKSSPNSSSANLTDPALSSSSADDESSFLSEDNAVTASSLNSGLDAFRDEYLRTFTEIQTELGFPINELNYEGLWFDQKCQIFDIPPNDILLEME